MEKPSLLIVCSAAFLLLGFVTSVHGQGTRVGFYSTTCPTAESIVRATVEKHFQSNPRIAPGLLRSHFHDCFVQGCDGSVLIVGPGTERSAPQNSATPGYDVIDDAKTQIEAACPGVVSCADILALAARDAVVVTKGISWKVPTGRRDGRVSVASEASTLPRATDSIEIQTRQFSEKNLNTLDLVVLVGGHTIGTTSCGQFLNRLYNFNTTTGADPSIDPSFVAALRSMCPEGGDRARRVDMDTGSGITFDTSYFTNLRNGRGILESDQKLWTDASTRPFVQRLLGGARPTLNFKAEFAKSMVKMGNIGLKTGTEGEIRTVCTAIN